MNGTSTQGSQTWAQRTELQPKEDGTEVETKLTEACKHSKLNQSSITTDSHYIKCWIFQINQRITAQDLSKRVLAFPMCALAFYGEVLLLASERLLGHPGCTLYIQQGFYRGPKRTGNNPPIYLLNKAKFWVLSATGLDMMGQEEEASNGNRKQGRKTEGKMWPKNSCRKRIETGTENQF